MKRNPSRPSKVCNAILAFSSGIHLTTGLAVIVFQIMLIRAMSPYHDIGGGLWAGPVFFIQGVLGFICLCDTLMCSVVSFLISSIIGALLTVALTAIAAVDVGSVYKCPQDDYRSALFYPAYCNPYSAPKISHAGWGIILACLIQLVASAASIFICMRIIYSRESVPAPALSMPYLYDEIPSPMSQQRFRASLQSANDKVQAYRSKSSTYSLNSTLPVRRSKSVDMFSEDTDSFCDNAMMASTHSVNVAPIGSNGRYKGGARYKEKPARAQSNSVYSVLQPPGRAVRALPRPSMSTRSLNVNNDLPGYMKHTAV